MRWFEQSNSMLKGTSYLGVNLLDWAIIIGLTALFWIGLKFLKKRAVRKLSEVAAKTSAHWDDILVRVIQKTHGIFLFILSLYASAGIIDADPKAMLLLYKFFVVSMFFQAALWGNEVLGYGLSRYLAQRYGQKDETIDNLSTYSVINITAKFILWTVLFLLLLDNLGVNITALVTGLGIGGIAIALAVQNILGDIFASLTIVMDQPFEVGDSIVVEGKSGKVEAVGLKTSRIRADSGEQLVIPNKKLIDGFIQNYKRMEQRRASFSFKIDYQVEQESLERIPLVVAEIVKSKENIRFDRAHLAKLGESGLIFEVVYTVLSSDYNLHMDIQQQIYFEIIAAMRELNASFSAPPSNILIPSNGDVEGSKIMGNSGGKGTAAAR